MFVFMVWFCILMSLSQYFVVSMWSYTFGPVSFSHYHMNLKWVFEPLQKHGLLVCSQRSTFTLIQSTNRSACQNAISSISDNKTHGKTQFIESNRCDIITTRKIKHNTKHYRCCCLKHTLNQCKHSAPSVVSNDVTK